MARKERRAKTSAGAQRHTDYFPLYPPAPLPASNRPKRIVIVGAGLSGLMAGQRLASTGHEVVMLEARNRVGGRVLTLRTGLSSEIWVDAGPMSIPGHHTYTVGLARDCGIEPRPLTHPTGKRILYLRDTAIAMPAAPASLPFDLSQWEVSTDVQSWCERYIGSPAAVLADTVHDFRHPEWVSEYVVALDAITLRALLRREGASPGAIDVIRRGFPDVLGEGIDHFSALQYLRDAVMTTLPMMAGGEACNLDGGMDSLPNAVAKTLSPQVDLRLSTVVLSVGQSAKTVRIDAYNARETYQLKADYVLCTVPPPVLRNLRFEPDLPADKWAAIHQLQFTSVARVFLEFDKRFWEACGLSGTAATDLPGPPYGDPDWPGLWINEPPSAESWKQPDGPGVLDIYVSGEWARRITAMNEASRLAFVLNHVDTIFPGAKRHFSGGGASKCWDEDPWALGAYAAFSPSQLTSQSSILQRQEGRIHFAGDYTSVAPGWIQGALESGVRAAAEIHETA